jgi:hypothetical protein
MEASYREFFQRTFSGVLRAGMSAVVQLLLVLAAVWCVAVQEWCGRCSERWFVGLSAIPITVISVTFLVRWRHGVLSQGLQGLGYVVCAATYSLQTIIQVKHCPTWLPPATGYGWAGRLPDFALPVMLSSALTASFVHFACIPWPLSVPYIAFGTVLHTVCMAVLFVQDQTLVTLLVL